MDVQNSLLLSPKGKTRSLLYAHCVFLKVLADGPVTCEDVRVQMLLFKEEPGLTGDHWSEHAS